MIGFGNIIFDNAVQSGGGGAVVGAENALTLDTISKKVQLGGNLIKDTNLTGGDGLYPFEILGMKRIKLQTRKSLNIDGMVLDLQPGVSGQFELQKGNPSATDFESGMYVTLQQLSIYRRQKKNPAGLLQNIVLDNTGLNFTGQDTELYINADNTAYLRTTSGELALIEDGTDDHVSLKMYNGGFRADGTRVMMFNIENVAPSDVNVGIGSALPISSGTVTFGFDSSGDLLFDNHILSNVEKFKIQRLDGAFRQGDANHYFQFLKKQISGVTLSIDTSNYISVKINGTDYKIALAVTE